VAAVAAIAIGASQSALTLDRAASFSSGAEVIGASRSDQGKYSDQSDETNTSSKHRIPPTAHDVRLS